MPINPGNGKDPLLVGKKKEIRVVLIREYISSAAGRAIDRFCPAFYITAKNSLYPSDMERRGDGTHAADEWDLLFYNDL